MNIPQWLKTHLKSEQADQIADAIRQAESTTSGEIVPMIVRRSSTIGHVPVILLTLLVALFFILDGPGWQAEAIGEHWAWYLVDVAILLMVTAVGVRLPWMQRLLTTRADQALQVDSRSVIEFYESHMHRTKDATGVLIFISLMEHRAVVLADKAIDDKVASDTWKEVCDQLITGIKKKTLGQAISDAVLRCGQIVTPEFPIAPDDENELRDNLIIKE
jgi:putative membrane protein